jgi:hypothetical protein
MLSPITSPLQYFRFVDEHPLCVVLFTAPWYVKRGVGDAISLNNSAVAACAAAAVGGPSRRPPLACRPRCFRCKQVEPRIATLPGPDFPGVCFARVDLDEVPELGDVLDIAALPSFVLYKAGAEAARVAGVQQRRPARTVAQAIRVHLLGAPEQ